MKLTRNILAILLLIISTLKANEAGNFSGLEGHVELVTKYSVCVTNGAFVQSEVDAIVECAEPLKLSRTYTSSHMSRKRNFQGYWVTVPEARMNIIAIRDEEYKNRYTNIHYVIPEPHGGEILYEYLDNGAGRVRNKDFNHFTNNASGILSGQTNLKNNYLHAINKSVGDDRYDHMLIQGDGTKRFYSRKNGFNDFYLKRVEMPNGNLKIYNYYKDTYRPKSIEIKNADQETIAWAEYEYFPFDAGYTVKLSNGQEVRYNNGYNPYDPKHSCFLRCNDSPYVPKIDYVYYTKHPKKHGNQDLSTYHWDGVPESITGCLAMVKRPNNRYLKNEYYDGSDSRKVSKQFAPVGKDSSPIQVASYVYLDDRKNKSTTFYDAYNTKTVYILDHHDRIQNIQYFDNDGILNHKDQFVWGQDGSKDESNLICKYSSDRSGVYFAKMWEYDTKGNVLQDKTIGNIKGDRPKYIQMNKKNFPIAESSDCMTITNSYSQDEYNLLLKSIDSKGLVTEFNYYPKSNKLKEKYITDQKIYPSMMLREFFDYDNCAQVICHISDNGITKDRNDLSGVTERKISRSKYNELGKPAEITFAYYDFESQSEIIYLTKKIEYNKIGKPTKEIILDENGQIFSIEEFEYDERGRLIHDIDVLGRVSKHEYDENFNEILRENPQINLKQVFTYDYSNRLIQHDAIYPEKTLTTKKAYDYLSNCICSTDPFGRSIKTNYDSFGRAVKIETSEIDGGNPTVVSEYNCQGHLISLTDAFGNTTKTTYNVFGKPIIVEKADGTIQRFAYNIDGSLFSSVDTCGSTRYMTYDVLGRLIESKLYSQEGELLDQSTLAYDSYHLISKTDGLGNTTHYKYDQRGRKISEYTDVSYVDYFYDSMGRQNVKKLWSDDKNYKLEVSVFDVAGRLIEEYDLDAEGIIQKRLVYTHDENDNVIKTEQFLDNDRTAISFTEFDNLKRIVKKIDACGNVTLFNYHEVQEGAFYRKIATSTDPLGRQTITQFNAFDKVVSLEIKSPSGQTLKLQKMAYDNALNLISHQEHIYQDGNFVRIYEVRNEYGPCNRIKKQIEAYGTKDERITEYTYDFAGRLQYKIKPDGVTLVHTYDGKGRLKTLCSTHSDSVEGINYEYSYDSNDNLLISHDIKSNTKTSRTYKQNLLISETLGHGSNLNYIYDLFGRLTSISLPDQSKIDYGYSASHLMQVVRTSKNGQSTQFDYNKRSASGKVLQITTPIGIFDYKYDTLDRISEIHTPKFDIDEMVYDPCQNITSFTWHDPKGSLPCEFAYDDLNQLILERGIGNHDLKYDSLHNRIKADDDKYTTNNLNQYTSVNNKQFLYDLCGNLICEKSEDDSITYRYDALDRLVEINRNDRRKAQYAYDSFHRRIAKHVYQKEKDDWKSISDLYFVYEGIKEIGSVNAQGEIVELRTLSTNRASEIGAALAIELDHKIYIPIHDHRGCVVSLVDLDRNVAEFYRYNAFGQESVYSPTKERLILSKLENPWRFSSKRFDEETGFTYFGRRYYHSNLGRWISQDPEGYKDGYNLYAYVHNQYLTHVDPWGLFSWFNDWGPKNAPFDKTGSYQAQTTTYNGRRSCFNWNEKTGKIQFENFRIESHYSRTYYSFTGRPINIFEKVSIRESTYTTNVRFGDEKKTLIFGHEPTPSKIKHYGYSGQLTDFDSLVFFGANFSKALGGKEVEIMNHPMENVLNDAFTYCGMFLNRDLDQVKYMEKRFTQDVSNGYEVFIVAHSRGALFISNVMDRIKDPVILSHIHIVTLGGATYIEDAKAKNVRNYYNGADLIPQHINTVHKYLKQFDIVHAIRLETPKDASFIGVHSFDNKSYQEAITNSYEEFFKGL